jgi:ribosomal protein L15E
MAFARLSRRARELRVDICYRVSHDTHNKNQSFMAFARLNRRARELRVDISYRVSHDTHNKNQSFMMAFCSSK